MKETYIYALVDPRNSRVRYIGKADNPEKRLLMHMREARKVKGRKRWNKWKIVSPKLVWLDELIQADEYPLLVIIESCPCSKWKEVEGDWMLKLHRAGAKLTNVKTPAGLSNFHNDLYFPPREPKPVKILGRFKIIRKPD